MRGAVSTLWPASAERARRRRRRRAPTRPGHARPQAAHAESTRGPVRLDPVALVRQAATAVHAAAQGRDLGTTITCVVGPRRRADPGARRRHPGLPAARRRPHPADGRPLAGRGDGRQRRHHRRGGARATRTATRCSARSGASASCRPATSTAWRPPTGSRASACSRATGCCSARTASGAPSTDREIQVVLTEALDCQNAARALIDRALQGGAPDNATAVVARCVRRPVL